MKLFAIQHKTTKQPHPESFAAGALDAWVRFMLEPGNGDLRRAMFKVAEQQGYQLVEVEFNAVGKPL